MIIETVKSDVVTNKGTGLSFKSVASALKINSIGGKSVQNGTPTPDAPVDINSANIKAVKVTGKNLFNYEEVVPTWYKKAGSEVLRKVYTLKPNTTYTMSALNVLNGAGYCFILSGSDLDFAATSAINGVINSRSVVTDSQGKLMVGVYPNRDGHDIKDVNIQLEENTVATPYEPYKENWVGLSNRTTLRSVGNVKDVICKQDNVWGVLRRVGEIVLNGSETWTATTLNRVYTSVISSTVKKPIDNKTKGNARSTHYAIRGKDGLDTGCFAIETTGALFFLDNTNGTSASTFKTWLQSNNITVLYELAAPVFEPLPDADQNVFNSLSSYDGITVITTDSSIEPELCVTNAVSLTGAYVLESDRALGGCYFKREGDKFYIGYNDGTSIAEMEV